METSHNATDARELGIDAHAAAALPDAVFTRIAPASPPSDDAQDLVSMLAAARLEAQQLEQQLEETRRALAEEIAKRQRVERKLGKYEEHVAELEQVLELL